jgi:hypothetical protein
MKNKLKNEQWVGFTTFHKGKQNIDDGEVSSNLVFHT